MSDVRPRDHLEVRDLRSNLLGWLHHQSPDTISRYGMGIVIPLPSEDPDPDLDYVEEDEDGAKTVHIALVGEQLELGVHWMRREFDTLTPKEIVTAEVPSYAKAVYKPIPHTNLYEWPAVTATMEQAEQVFDLDIFEPHAPHLTIQEIVALDEEAKWHDPILSLLRPATTAPNVISAHKILSGTKTIRAADIVAGTVSAAHLVHTPSYPGRAGSGYQS